MSRAAAYTRPRSGSAPCRPLQPADDAVGPQVAVHEVAHVCARPRASGARPASTRDRQDARTPATDARAARAPCSRACCSKAGFTRSNRPSSPMTQSRSSEMSKMSSTTRSARRRRTIARPTRYTMSAVAGGHSTATHGSVVCSAVAGSGSTSTRQRRVRDSKPSLAAGATSSPPSSRCPSRLDGEAPDVFGEREAQPARGHEQGEEAVAAGAAAETRALDEEEPSAPGEVVVIGVAVPANTDVGSRSVAASACTSETSVPSADRRPRQLHARGEGGRQVQPRTSPRGARTAS